jgi:hypothetical protein
VPKILVEANGFAAALPTLLLVNSIGPNFIVQYKVAGYPYKMRKLILRENKTRK